MCHGFGFYNYPGSMWFMGGTMLFRALIAVGLLILGYKLIKNIGINKTHTDWLKKLSI